jgi:nickel/cobalt transporter (NiCoT) family protein
VVVALLIGTIELAQVIAAALNLHGWLIDVLTALNFETLGYAIVGLFIFWWACAAGLWKLRRMDERLEFTS